MKKDYRKSFTYLFVGLLVSFVAFDISFGVSPIDLTFVPAIVGFVFIAVSFKELKEVSPKFKIVLIMQAIYLAIVLGSTVNNTLTIGVDVDTIVEETSILVIPEELYGQLYLSAFITLFSFLTESLGIIFTVGGCADFAVNENIVPLIDDSETLYKKIKVAPIIFSVVAFILGVLMVPLMHCLDGLDLEALSTGGPLPAQITDALGFSLIILLVGIVYLVFIVLYLVKYIKGLVLVNKFTKVAPLVEDTVTVDCVEVNTETEPKEDNWQDDFK